MKWASTVGLVALAALSQAWAVDAAQESGPTGLSKDEASIPFVNLDSTIRTWQADGQNGVWIQDAHKQWYYAKTFGYCEGLEFSVRLGIQTGTLNMLDRYSYIVVPGYGRCALKSLVKSDAPPKGKQHAEVNEVKADK
jgi:hypothetical protein